jgi:hypothetical protein
LLKSPDKLAIESSGIQQTCVIGLECSSNYDSLLKTFGHPVIVILLSVSQETSFLPELKNLSPSTDS